MLETSVKSLLSRAGYHLEEGTVGAGRRHLADHRRVDVAGSAQGRQGGLGACSGHAEEETARGLRVEDQVEQRHVGVALDSDGAAGARVLGMEGAVVAVPQERGGARQMRQRAKIE